MNTQSLSRICASAVALIGLSTGAFAQEQSLAAVDTMVPDWVKSAAKLYANGHTSHDDFMGVMTVALNATNRRRRSHGSTNRQRSHDHRAEQRRPNIIKPAPSYHGTWKSKAALQCTGLTRTTACTPSRARIRMVRSTPSSPVISTPAMASPHTFDEPGLYRLRLCDPSMASGCRHCPLMRRP